MKERKELKKRYGEIGNEYGEPVNTKVYVAEEADAVMDKYEERIKGLYDDLHEIATDLGIANERIKELEASQPKWVSFKSKVPTMYQNILVNVPGANKENRMEPTRSIFWCPAREEELKVGLLYYTHWMPLPNPPTDEVK